MYWQITIEQNSFETFEDATQAITNAVGAKGLVSGSRAGDRWVLAVPTNLEAQHEVEARLAGAGIAGTVRPLADGSTGDLVEASRQFDPLKADAAYEPIEEFGVWSAIPLDTTRWDAAVAGLENARETDAETYRRAGQIVARIAAIETGAIEGLYDSFDRGFTVSMAVNAAVLATALADAGEETRRLIESQIEGYDQVLDLATGEQPIAEAWIRQLHETLCQGQDTYRVLAGSGLQQQPLPHGEYKHHPNHVRLQNGTIHPYAPVDATPEEMHRLCEQLRSEEFLEAHPILQAAYAHHCLVRIHPFADGNGRVARALASVYLFRSNSLPLLILNDHKKEYLDALRAADQNAPPVFVSFVEKSAAEGAELFRDALENATGLSLKDAVEGVQNVYRTDYGIEHDAADRAGLLLYDAVLARAAEIAKETQAPPELRLDVRQNVKNPFKTAETHRPTIKPGPRSLAVVARTTDPAPAQVEVGFQIEVPRATGGSGDRVILRTVQKGTEAFSERVSDLLPRLSLASELRLRLMLERHIAQLLLDLEKRARDTLAKKGY